MSKNGFGVAVVAAVVSVVVLAVGAVGIQKYRESQCDHVYDSGKVTVEATCTKDGKMKFTCEECGKKKVEVIEAEGHVEVLVEETAATCDKSGNTAGKVCSVCEEILEDMKEIPKLGHDIVAIAAKAATCTEDGNTAGLVCGRCDYAELKSEIIPAGHTWEYDGTIIIPTCSKEGEGKYVCEVCGETKLENIGLSPDYHSYDEGAVTTSPTCTTEGVTTYTCEDCGSTKTEEIPATDHDYDIGTVTTEPTCAASGVRTYTCLDCGTTKTESIYPTANHNYVGVTQAPTCTEDGEFVETCTVCNHKTVTKISASGHLIDPDCYIVGTTATCTTEGLKQYPCANCSYYTEETIPVDPTAHNWDEGVVSEGIKTYTCLDCGATKTGEEETCDHDYSTYGYCSLCTEPQSEEVTVAAGDKLLGYTYKGVDYPSLYLLTDDGTTLCVAIMSASLEMGVVGDDLYYESQGMYTDDYVGDPMATEFWVFKFNAGTYTFGEHVITIDENTTISKVSGDLVRVANTVSEE